jgi:hypothetical protein
MEETAIKLSDYKIQVTKTADPVVTVHEYDINFLLKQKKDIQASKDAFDALRDAELKEIDGLLAHCDTYGITALVEDIKPLPIEDIKPSPIEEITPLPVEDITPLPVVVAKKSILDRVKKFFKWR